MPLYEYECRKCHHRFERIQQFSDKPVRRCPKCKTGRVKKLISSPAVHFKGTGWYVTDYGGKKSSGDKSESGDKSDSGKPEGDKSESGKSEEKSASKASSSKDASAKKSDKS